MTYNVFSGTLNPTHLLTYLRTSLNIVFVVATTGSSCWCDFTYQSFLLTQLPFILLVNVNYAVARPSVVGLSVCRL